jgi:subtilisin family serine protease
LHPAIGFALPGACCIQGCSGIDFGQQEIPYPAGYPQVIDVASVNPLDQRSLFSNHGDNLVRVAAPGEGLIAPIGERRFALRRSRERLP